LVTWCPQNPGINVAGCTPAPGLPDPTTAVFDHAEISIYGPDPDFMYAMFGDCTSPILYKCSPAIYHSMDGGATWTEQTNTPPTAYSRYTHVLTIHPSNPSTIIYGGIGLWRSEDGGKTYTKLGGCTLHPDHHAVVFPDPAVSFDLAVILQAGDGSNHRLCTVNVRVTADTEPDHILMHARDLINDSQRCAAHTVQAEVLGLRPEVGDADPPGGSGRLSISAPG
jgi:hypothetical protein